MRKYARVFRYPVPVMYWRCPVCISVFCMRCFALVLSTVVAGALAGNGGVAYLIDHCISLGICFFHRTVCFGGSFGIYVFFICFVGAEPAKEFFFEYAFCGGFLYASLSACLAV